MSLLMEWFEAGEKLYDFAKVLIRLVIVLEFPCVLGFDLVVNSHNTLREYFVKIGAT